MRTKSKFTTTDFISKARLVHGDKYDYSKVEYVNCKTKVCIVCPIHGEFWQRAAGHLIGKGCQFCGRLGSTYLKSNTADFIKRAKTIHGDTYEYSNVEYIDRATPVNIICPIHGMFRQAPFAHIYGQGCPKCKGVKISETKTNKFNSYGAINDMITGEYNDKAYKHWRSMLGRCYSPQKSKAYEDCVVCQEWLTFSNFCRWFEENYIEGNSLDKDILIKGNKVYSPETCCFVPIEVNTMFVTNNRKSNDLPTGVHYSKNRTRFFSIIDIGKKQIRLGTFDTIEEAANAYKKARKAHLNEMAEKYKDRMSTKTYLAIKNYEV